MSRHYVLRILLGLLLACGFSTSVYAATLNFAWDDPNNDPATLSGYRLERSADRAGPWVTAIDVPVTPLTASDTVEVQGLMCWRVLAVSGEQVSPPSNVVCVTFPHAPVNVTVQITLSGVAQ